MYRVQMLFPSGNPSLQRIMYKQVHNLQIHRLIGIIANTPR